MLNNFVYFLPRALFIDHVIFDSVCTIIHIIIITICDIVS